MKRYRHLSRLLVAGAAALALSLPVAVPRPAFADNITPPPSRDPNVQPPAGNMPHILGHVLTGAGTQTYTCTSSDTWGTSSTPDAILTDDHGKQIIHHTAGPMWTSLQDGSSVTGAVFYKDTMDAQPGAIPWLLLQAVSTAPGPDGGDRLTSITWIQRVNTAGGIAPTGSCTPGATQSVPYTADYYFYQAQDD